MPSKHQRALKNNVLLVQKKTDTLNRTEHLETDQGYDSDISNQEEISGIRGNDYSFKKKNK